MSGKKAQKSTPVPEQEYTRTFTPEELAMLGKLVTVGQHTSRSTVAVIDTMAQRGAIKGEEMETLGQLRSACVELAALTENFNSVLSE